MKGDFRSFYFVLIYILDVLTFWSITNKYREHYKQRRMSCFNDWHNWLGCCSSKVEELQVIYDLYLKNGLAAQQVATCSDRFGYNQFYTARVADTAI